MNFIQLCLILTTVLQCNGVGLYDHLPRYGHRRRAESRRNGRVKLSRRFSFGGDPILMGVPSRPSHLPPAEPILPGHTLLKPAMGMLKSAVKFPHREQENGSGVYGHIDNIGIRYDGKNERVMYSKFRRMPTRRSLAVMMPDRYNTKQQHIVDYINSLRRQEALKKETYFNDVGSKENNEEEMTKTKIFWSTKDAFNHIKVNPDAPDLSELIPSEALEDVRNWWFYNQLDFKDFEDRR